MGVLKHEFGREQPRNTPKITIYKTLIGFVAIAAAFKLFTSDLSVFQHLNGASISAHNALCAQPQPPSKPSNYSVIYDSPEFRKRSAERLSGAIKIPTMSFDDMGPVDTDERWEPFKDLHKYLQDTFPLLYLHSNVTVVGGYSLVLTLQGSNASLKPLLLAAHQDVVPSVTSLEKWTHPPFSGAIDGNWIYGRGSSDCKNNLIGIMSAAENLLDNKWSPRRTIILAFGQDEEIGGPRGAGSIAQYLQEVYGEDGIAMIVDEGGMGLDTLYGQDFALPGIAEKGHINLVVRVDMLGGHSSVPSDHTTIGILSKIVSTVEDSDVFQPSLNKESPIWGYLTCVASHGDRSKIPSWIKNTVFSKKPDMNRAAEEFAKTSPANRYLVQTSKAATIFNAGLKSNALAESAVATFNSRLDIFSSTSEVKNIYFSLIKPIAEKYSLTVNGISISSQPSIGNITITSNEPTEPSPISPFDLSSPEWVIFSKAVQASFGENVISAPSAMTGNTDTRHYVHLSKNIYRWSPARIGTRLNAHTVDEKIEIDTHVAGIRFYTELIIQADE